jgi:hypothetical protein
MPPGADGRGTAHLRPANSTPGSPPGFAGAASAGRSDHSASSDTRAYFPPGNSIIRETSHRRVYHDSSDPKPASCCLLLAARRAGMVALHSQLVVAADRWHWLYTCAASDVGKVEGGVPCGGSWMPQVVSHMFLLRSRSGLGWPLTSFGG